MKNDDTTRTIEHVLDVESGEIISSNEFFNQPEATIIHYRRVQEEAIKGYVSPKYLCPNCLQIVKIIGRRTSRGKAIFFSHTYNSEVCEIKVNTNYSKGVIEAIKYNGQRESERHWQLKHEIYNALNKQSEIDSNISNVQLEARIKSDNPLLNWRQPDVSAIYKGTPIVFELQLSTTFLSVIVGRDLFYKLNSTFIVWVFNFSMNQEFVNLTNLMCKDIYYANKRNAFIFDEEAQKRSQESGKLVLLCVWFEPMLINGQYKKGSVTKHQQYIGLEDLKFDSIDYKPYFIDADSLFAKHDPSIKKDRKFDQEYQYSLLQAYEQILIQKQDEIDRKNAEEESLKAKIISEVEKGLHVLSPIKKKGKWGLGYEDVIIVDTIYNSIGPFTDSGLATVRRNSRSGYINTLGKEVIPCNYNKAYDFNGSTALVKDKYNYWSIINRNCKTIREYNKNFKIKDFKYNLLISKNTTTYTKNNWIFDKVELELINYNGELLSNGKYSNIYARNLDQDKPNLNSYVPIDTNELLVLCSDDEQNSEVILIDEYSISNNIYNYRKNGKWGIIDDEFNIIVNNEFDSPHIKYDNIFTVKKGNLWGLSSGSANIEDIHFEYEYFWNKDNYFKCKNENGWGIKDTNGKELIPNRYSEIGEFNNDIAQIYLGDNVGLVNIDGTILIPVENQKIKSINDNFFLIKKHNKFGISDRKGSIIIECIYDSIDYNKQCFQLERNGNYGIANENGIVIIECEYEKHSLWRLNNNLFIAKRENKYGLVLEENGKFLLPIEYTDIESLGEHLISIQKNNKFGLLDKTKGNPIIDCIYDSIEPFSYRYLKVIIDQKSGLINSKSGKQCVECIYDEIDIFQYESVLSSEIEYKSIFSRFSIKLLKTKSNNKYGLINADTAGIILDCKYDEINHLIDDKIFITRIENKWSFINLENASPLHSPLYESIRIIKEASHEVFKTSKKPIGNLLLVQKDELFGLVDYSNNEILPTRYQVISTFKLGITRTKRDGKWGCMNKIGEIVIPFVYDEIQEFYNGYTTIHIENAEALKINKLARFIKDGKRGYLDSEGNEYWQYWKDKRDFKKRK